MPHGPALRALRAAQEEEIQSLEQDEDFAAFRPQQLNFPGGTLKSQTPSGG